MADRIGQQFGHYRLMHSDPKFFSTQISANNWYHFVGTLGEKIATMYLNGAVNGTVSIGTTPTPTLDGVIIGRNKDGGEYWFGYIDEVRISDIARSAGWIATEYNNQSSPSTFYSVSSLMRGTT